VAATDGESRSRVEFDDGVTSGVHVSNGETVWVYFPHLKKYSRFSLSPSQGPNGGLTVSRGLDLSKITQRYTGRYRGAADGLIEAKVVRSETTDVGGHSFHCQVVEARYQPGPGLREGRISRTYWIDPQSKLVLRERSLASMRPANAAAPTEVVQEIEFQQASAGPGLDAELFVFDAPDGAEEAALSEIDSSGPSSLVGKAAPNFTLRDLAGNSVNLSELRGQVVLLDFWATWCGPCRIDMPRIQALHNELKARGLRVFGVNSEDAGLARAYVESNGYTFPTLSDAGATVFRGYEVTAIPTAVVIDTEGNVGAYLQGSGPKERLLEAIRKAGLRETAE
jgi:peroxiredoxin/outer membrane lipoprotein-sorting protein